MAVPQVEQTERKIVVEENLGLVHACAHRFGGRGVEYEDLYGAGCIGLILGRYRLIQDLQGKLELCSLPPHIAKVVHLAGIDHLLAQNSTGPKEDEQYV